MIKTKNSLNVKSLIKYHLSAAYLRNHLCYISNNGNYSAVTGIKVVKIDDKRYVSLDTDKAKAVIEVKDLLQLLSTVNERLYVIDADGIISASSVKKMHKRIDAIYLYSTDD